MFKSAFSICRNFPSKRKACQLEPTWFVDVCAPACERQTFMVFGKHVELFVKTFIAWLSVSFVRILLFLPRIPTQSVALTVSAPRPNVQYRLSCDAVSVDLCASFSGKVVTTKSTESLQHLQILSVKRNIENYIINIDFGWNRSNWKLSRI